MARLTSQLIKSKALVKELRAEVKKLVRDVERKKKQLAVVESSVEERKMLKRNFKRKKEQLAAVERMRLKRVSEAEEGAIGYRGVVCRGKDEAQRVPEAEEGAPCTFTWCA